MGDFANSTQVHDFEPGIADSGLFWTVPIPDSQISANPGAGRGRYQATDMALPGYHDFFNSISPNPPIPAVASHVSFDVRWAGSGNRAHVDDSTFQFVGDFVDGPISIDFTAKQDSSPVVYRSRPTGQTTIGGGLGHERNGRFFK